MKYLLALFGIIFFWSCQTIENNKVGKPYFDFDEIVYYENPNYFVDSIVSANTDDLIYKIVQGDYPDKIQTDVFERDLDSLKFKKYQLSNEHFSDINEIFREKKVDEFIAFACIPNFNDILIFKKNRQTVGVAKLCFNCLQYNIIGTDANTEHFGQNGDMNKLQKILIQYNQREFFSQY